VGTGRSALLRYKFASKVFARPQITSTRQASCHEAQPISKTILRTSFLSKTLSYSTRLHRNLYRASLRVHGTSQLTCAKLSYVTKHLPLRKAVRITGALWAVASDLKRRSHTFTRVQTEDWFLHIYCSKARTIILLLLGSSLISRRTTLNRPFESA
jgi:hypothetical protein